VNKNSTPHSIERLIPAFFRTGLLRTTVLSGIMLILLIGGVLVGIYGTGTFSRDSLGIEKESEFSRLLREYDFKCRRVLEEESPVVRLHEFERLESELDRLEKKAGGVESWLSVLKRRRQLADYAGELGGMTGSQGAVRYTESYRQSSRRAAKAFPYSEPIAAVVAAALVHDSAITREGEAELRKILPLLASIRFAPMRLGFHVLLGDFKDPERAAASLPVHFGQPLNAPSGEGVVIPDFLNPQFPLAPREAGLIAIDLLILKILAGDVPGAGIDIQTALFAFPSSDLTRLAAEYFYDFGDPVRSAELFSMLPDEAALSRQGDALWLAGYGDSARAIWTMLSMYNSGLQNRALYNLAITSQTAEDAVMLLERLIRQPFGTGEDPSRQYGLIRFSRFLEASPALAVLNAERGPPCPVDPIIDLEILKRRTEIGEMPRVIAETWLLLDRYPEVETLYQWGLWYFDLQRNYTESAMLLKTAARHQFTGWWIDLYGVLQNIRNGDPDTAEKLLAGIPIDSHWAVAANAGRMLEARHAPSRALESYERAIALVTEQTVAWPNIASRIQVRIARCLRSMDRFDESRRALDYALDLNPDNLNARLELSRLE
jgi:tetratricopeptide (TPR) repeat protein